MDAYIGSEVTAGLFRLNLKEANRNRSYSQIDDQGFVQPQSPSTHAAGKLVSQESLTCYKRQHCIRDIVNVNIYQGLECYD